MSDDAASFVEPEALTPASVRGCEVHNNWQSLLDALPKGGIVAEVGVDRGASSKRILDTVRPRELHLIDVEFRAPLDVEFADQIAAGVVHLHRGDSVAELQQVPDEYFDWIFVDGDHSLAGVRRDAEVAVRKIQHDGLLIFDDYIMFDHQQREFYGVVQVVNELCSTGDWRLAHFALQQEMFCKAVIQRVRPQE